MSAPSFRSSRPRVFHNTYTRQGRRMSVSGWSVKIQFRGRRRTFSLAARTRAAATAEAEQIFEKLRRGGWEAVEERETAPSPEGLRKTEASYWKERLLLRPRRFAGPLDGDGGFVTRIDHAGSASYFPLGESDGESAARRALALYQAVVEEGWDAVRQRFPREVCLACHWSYDPLVWTYTTLRTLPGGRAGSEAAPGGGSKRLVLVIESDPAVREALAWCLEQNPGCRCVTCPEDQAQAKFKDERRYALCLINARLKEPLSLATPDQLSALPNGTPALSYSTHADSDELFLSPPGGISGYFLSRSPAAQILAPVLAALDSGACSAEGLRRSAQVYAQRVLQSPRRGLAPGAAPRLTQREQEVLSLLSKGHVDKEVAEALSISAWTVHGHVKRIFEKLGVHSRLEAVLVYLQK